MKYLIEDLQELKPTMFCGVPRVYDRIYTGMYISDTDALRNCLVCSSGPLTYNEKITDYFPPEGIVDKISSSGSLKKGLFDYAYN